MAIKIGHEAPKSIFYEIEKVTDYSYALVHLFEEDQEYYNLFKKAVKQGREIILDNSIFELEKAFDADRFRYWVERLKPTWYIVPDVLENAGGTMAKMAEWNGRYRKGLPGKTVGVVQGKTYEEIVDCYEYMDNIAQVDMIAISFDYSYYEQSFPHSNKLVSWMLGRVKLLGDLLRDGIINETKPHHLLGVALYREGLYYKDYNWIYSMDTSNPVVYGIKNGIYIDPVWEKPSEKLFTLINKEVSPQELSSIISNIQTFNKAWNG